MRSRKPCVLARRRLFGWKVRLLTCTSLHSRLQGFRNPERWQLTGRSPGLRARRCWQLSSLATVRRRDDQGQTGPSSTGCGQLLWRRRPLRAAPSAPALRPRARRPQLCPGTAPFLARPVAHPPPPRGREVVCTRTSERCSYQHSEWPIGRDWQPTRTSPSRNDAGQRQKLWTGASKRPARRYGK
jgi:hypothetical protein